jgi:hypothetical protein
MNEEKRVRFLFDDPKAATFVYRPPNLDNQKALDCTIGVKFAQARLVLDDWDLFGGTRWSRALFRLRHPIVYSKRGLRKLWIKFRRLFVKDVAIQCKKK